MAPNIVGVMPLYSAMNPSSFIVKASVTIMPLYALTGRRCCCGIVVVAVVVVVVDDDGGGVVPANFPLIRPLAKSNGYVTAVAVIPAKPPDKKDMVPNDKPTGLLLLLLLVLLLVL